MTAPISGNAKPVQNGGRAALLVALAACGFGSISILVTFATAAGAPLLNVLSWRYVLAGATLWSIAAATRIRIFEPGWVRAVVTLGVMQSLIAGLSLKALDYIAAGTLSFLFYSYPAFVAIIARARHSEPLTRRRLTALGLALTGIVVMVGLPGSGSLHPMGVALALISALLYAIYIPILGDLQRERSPVTVSMYVAIGAAVMLSLVAAFRGELHVAMTTTAWLSVLWLALVSTVASFLMFVSGLGVLGPVRTAIISTVEPFFTAILGAWLLAQPLTVATLIGGAFIAAAVVLLQLGSRRNGSGR